MVDSAGTVTNLGSGGKVACALWAGPGPSPQGLKRSRDAKDGTGKSPRKNRRFSPMKEKPSQIEQRGGGQHVRLYAHGMETQFSEINQRMARSQTKMASSHQRGGRVVFEVRS